MSGIRDLWLRLRALVARRRVEKELDEELAFHLDREAHQLMANGMSQADARVRARKRFGPVALAADLCRDARGTALVDALVQDVACAFRAFRRVPLAAVTIVATVALGLGLVGAVFTVYSAAFLRVDAVRDPEELFGVLRAPNINGVNVWIPFTRSEYERLRRDTNVFTDVLAMHSGLRARIDTVREVDGTLVSGNFFDVLGVHAALGRALTPADAVDGRPVVVLSHKGWHTLFANDIGVVGRTVRIDGTPHDVVGVMPQGFRGLALTAPDYWVPLTRDGRLDPVLPGSEDELTVGIVGRLKPQMTPEAAATALGTWAVRADLRVIPGLEPALISLRPHQGLLSDNVANVLKVFASLFVAFGLILLIGCANVANLLLARGVSRGREIGVRLALGASRGRIVRQLLTESLLLALTAAAGGLLVSRLVLQAALYAARTAVPPELAGAVTSIGIAAADWRVVAFLVVGAVVSTSLFGLAPALHATRLELVRAMRGEVTEDAGPGHARHVLIASQVGASTLLLICATVFLRGTLSASAADPGLRTSDTVVVSTADESLRTAILEEVRAHPSVTAVAAVSPGVLNAHPTVAEALANGRIAGDDEALPTAARRRVPVGYQFVSPEYFDVLGIRVSRGRVFMPAERAADAGVVVVSEATARALWPDRDPIGQTLRFRTDQTPNREPGGSSSQTRTYAVVGVVRDVGIRSWMFGFSGAGLYLPLGPASAGISLAARVRDDPDQARLALLERLTRVDPALEDVRTVRAMVGMRTFVLRAVFRGTVALAALALILTVSGLVGVLLYVVAQRTREIGVRMALGATRQATAKLVLSQSLRPALIGLAAGGGLAAGLAAFLRSTRAADDIATLVRVLDPVAYAASLLVIVVACALAAWIPAMRAARIDPIATLRQD